MKKDNFYDGTKLLSMKDINGKKPELFLCTTNRSGGKTTYFNRLLVNRFKKQGKKFALIYRFNYELDNVAEKFFKDIQTLFFPNDEMTSKRRASGSFQELFLNDVSCGYGVTLNSADQLKKYSHFFSDVDSMLFDEFQSETNHYCPNEIEKLISLHTSIARGGGKQIRYVPVYMLSNSVSLINPYYTALGISSRLKTDTNFLRGTGFVLEQGFIDTASKLQKESQFNQAFSNSNYIAYASQNIYLNDNISFIERPNGIGKYLCTVKYKNKEYGIREFPATGIVYCDDKPDKNFPLKISCTLDDHSINYVMLRNNEFLISSLRWYFERGSFRFKDIQCKEMLLTLISYK